MAPTVELAIGIAVLLTSTLSGALGMGGGLLLMGVLLWVLPVPVAMVLHGVVQLWANGVRAAMLGRHILWSTFAWCLLTMAASTAGLWAAGLRLERGATFAVLGTVGLVGLLARNSVWASFSTARGAALCGAVVGTLQLTGGVSGPATHAFFVDGRLDRHAVVGTKATIQVVAHALKIAYFATALTFPIKGAGSLHAQLGWLACAAVGTALGRWILRRMGESRFLSWSRWLLGLASLVYLVRAALWALA